MGQFDQKHETAQTENVNETKRQEMIADLAVVAGLVSRIQNRIESYDTSGGPKKPGHPDVSEKDFMVLLKAAIRVNEARGALEDVQIKLANFETS